MTVTKHSDDASSGGYTFQRMKTALSITKARVMKDVADVVSAPPVGVEEPAVFVPDPVVPVEPPAPEVD